jgi:hypothetical protein
MTIGNKRVTRETAHGEKLIFFPKDAAEATQLQKKLLSMGIVWGNGNADLGSADECSKYGLVLDNGLMYHRSPQDKTRYEPCRIGQVGEEGAAAPVPQDRVLEMFERVAARLDAVERRLTGIEAELTPVPALDKQKLKGPGGGP